jgi:hypothetical protein
MRDRSCWCRDVRQGFEPGPLRDRAKKQRQQDIHDSFHEKKRQQSIKNIEDFEISLNDIFPSTTFNDRFLIYRNDGFFDCFTTGYISKPDYFERYLFHFHFVPSERCFYQRQVKLSATEVNMDILQIKNFASDLLNTLTHDELIKHSGYIKSNF